MSEWISVRDKLPKVNQWVLVYREIYDTIIIARLLPKAEFWEDDSTKDLVGLFDCWMPLPKKPEEVSDESKADLHFDFDGADILED